MKKIVILFLVSTIVMTGIAGESEKADNSEKTHESVSEDTSEAPSASVEALQRRFNAKYGKIIIKEDSEPQTKPLEEESIEPETDVLQETTEEETTTQEITTQETTTVCQTEPETTTEQQTEPETATEAQTQTPEQPQPDVAACAGGITLSHEDYNQLLSIVEAEAGDQDDVGKILVANVIFNRVRSSEFPGTVTEVIYQNGNGVYQFEPVLNGRIYSVSVTESTVDCVNRAIAGEDYSQGALYFTMKTSEGSWFNTSLTLLFVHGDHYFYTC